MSTSIILLENSNSSPPAKGAEGVFNKPFSYNKSRLSSLHQEQNIAKDLKDKLKEHYGKNKIPVARKHWSTIVNSYVYGNYPIKAIIKAIKFGGKTVHPTIPFSSWKRVKDYIDYIDK
ncbi:MAG: hypothetical protein GWO87_00610 [Xanthomonadaceae bacterium]|nr:hypothetical protein [Rhodospirillaceae bacterium]NIA17681.1 hypothetical protein [Xanthomonadaceae bacterium]